MAGLGAGAVLLTMGLIKLIKEKAVEQTAGRCNRLFGHRVRTAWAIYV